MRTTIMALMLVGTGFAVPATAAPLCDGKVATHVATHDGEKVFGGSGNDVLDANGFRNVELDGRGGDDSLCGGPGSDLLNGYDGADRMFGGPGDDTFLVNIANDYLVGGNGLDTVRFDRQGPGSSQPDGSSYLHGVQVDVRAGVAVWLTGMITFMELEGFDLADGGTTHTFIGTAAPDYVRSQGWLTADTGEGDDRVDATRGEVTLGAGNDHATLRGDTYLDAGQGDDYLVFTDYLGEHGHLIGGPGDDIFRIKQAHDNVSAEIQGGAGRDRLDLTKVRTRVSAHMGKGLAVSWRVALRWTSLQEFFGTPNADHITGSAHADWIDGRGGRDILIGGAGNDVLVGGASRDSVDGGAGRDRCSGERRLSCERKVT